MARKVAVPHTIENDIRFDIALRHYATRYDNAVYRLATSGLTVETCNRLLNDALAICGSPYHKRSRTRWAYSARKFLALFE